MKMQGLYDADRDARAPAYLDADRDAEGSTLL